MRSRPIHLRGLYNQQKIFEEKYTCAEVRVRAWHLHGAPKLTLFLRNVSRRSHLRYAYPQEGANFTGKHVSLRAQRVSPRPFFVAFGRALLLSPIRTAIWFREHCG